MKHSSQAEKFTLDTRQGKLAGLFAASDGCGGFGEFLRDQTPGSDGSSRVAGHRTLLVLLSKVGLVPLVALDD